MHSEFWPDYWQNTEKNEPKRDVSLRGRILLTKAEGIFCLKYAAWSLDVNKKVSKDIDKMLLNVTWRNTNHYIKKSFGTFTP